MLVPSPTSFRSLQAAFQAALYGGVLRHCNVSPVAHRKIIGRGLHTVDALEQLLEQGKVLRVGQGEGRQDLYKVRHQPDHVPQSMNASVMPALSQLRRVQRSLPLVALQRGS